MAHGAIGIALQARTRRRPTREPSRLPVGPGPHATADARSGAKSLDPSRALRCYRAAASAGRLCKATPMKKMA